MSVNLCTVINEDERIAECTRILMTNDPAREFRAADCLHGVQRDWDLTAAHLYTLWNYCRQMVGMPVQSPAEMGTVCGSVGTEDAQNEYVIAATDYYTARRVADSTRRRCDELSAARHRIRYERAKDALRIAAAIAEP